MPYKGTRSEIGDREYTYRRGSVRDFDDDLSIDVNVRERDRIDRTPAFLREDARRTDAGPLVLRSREVETVDRRRARSPSPQVVYRRPRFTESSPSPPPPPPPGPRVSVIDRVDRRQRERSSTPELDRDLIRLRIERERQKERTPSSSPSPPPPAMPAQPNVIRGPTIEREVITHYRDIDHGTVRVKPPSPPPAAPPRRAVSRSRRREVETDIDIDIKTNETDIDIRQRSRSRSRPPERIRPQFQPQPRPSYYDDDDIVLVKNRDTLKISEKEHRRAHSAAPRADWNDEAEYITNRIDARGRMGEAKNGATRDWSIVDVPPGTERVRMDGVGGASTEMTWQRYNGVRRSRFLPDGDDAMSAVAISEPAPDTSRDRVSVQIIDKNRDREIEVEDVRDRRISIRDSDRHSARKRDGMWTEITKDLVIREAIERLGYDYEETEYYFYVMHYLHYEDVLELVDTSDDIRRNRRRRARESDEHSQFSFDRRHHRSHRRDNVDEEIFMERDVTYDAAPRYYR
ncbi:hypothetical protein GGS21DRAFT_521514 [Xylaria nigripes]|nr:hypothetical protein GGS21DRAFT_521514 [Xylaria nigripes]